MRDFLYHVRRSLLAAQPAAPRSRTPRPAMVVHGPKLVRASLGAKQTKEPDWVILEIRRLRETRGMSPGCVRMHFARLGHELTENRIRSVMAYTTRAHLVPDAGRRDPYAA